MSETLALSLQNNKAELQTVNQALVQFFEPHNLTPRIKNAVNLVLEELLINVIQYGYDDDAAHTIDVDVTVESERIAITLTDNGVAFNPLAVPRPDRSRPVMERLESGIGINLVRHIRKAMEYRREEGNNILTIWLDK